MILLTILVLFLVGLVILGKYINELELEDYDTTIDGYRILTDSALERRRRIVNSRRSRF